MLLFSCCGMNKNKNKGQPVAQGPQVSSDIFAEHYFIPVTVSCQDPLIVINYDHQRIIPIGKCYYVPLVLENAIDSLLKDFGIVDKGQPQEYVLVNVICKQLIDLQSLSAHIIKQSASCSVGMPEEIYIAKEKLNEVKKLLKENSVDLVQGCQPPRPAL